MAAHARLSPSSAERWMQCPGSVALIDRAEVDTVSDSPFAKEGTLAHEAAEIQAAIHFGLITEAEYDRRHLIWVDKVPDADDREEMRVHAEAYVQLLDRMVTDEPGTLMLEKRVKTGVPGIWGTADAVLIGRNHIRVIDYKYGMGVRVDAENNPQLMLYGLGALAEYGDLVGDIETISVTVHQPRLGHTSHYSISVDDLRRWRDDEVAPMAQLALDGTGYLSPSETACRFCPVAGQCRARAEYMTRRDFGDPDLLDNTEIARALEQIPDIEKWCTQVKETALTKAYHDGEEIPGFKVVRSGQRRKITDEQAAVDALVNAGFERAQVVRESIQTLGKLERLTGGRRKMEAVIGDLIEQSEGREALVPEWDSRPAINANDQAKADFS